MDDLRVLLIDLDMKDKKKAIETLTERLWFLSGLKLLNIESIIKIELSKKKNYSAKVHVNHDIPIQCIIVLQLLLGSDYRKEAITLKRHFDGEPDCNWMFDYKHYISKGEFIKSEKEDITTIVMESNMIKQMRGQETPKGVTHHK